MSTKTTFKRIALVAVASLGFGVLSVVPSIADDEPATSTVSVADASASVAVGSPASTTVNLISAAMADDLGTFTVTPAVVSSPAGSSVTITTDDSNGTVDTDISTSGEFGMSIAGADKLRVR